LRSECDANRGMSLFRTCLGPPTALIDIFLAFPEVQDCLLWPDKSSLREVLYSGLRRGNLKKEVTWKN